MERFRQAGVDGVLLNETLLWIFSSEIDRTSVTRESVRVEDLEGRAVPGRLEVEGRRLQFVPQLPRGADLADGSFRPGVRYRVALAGFPRPDAVRARSGAPLDVSWETQFRAAQSGRGMRVFEDPRLGPPAPIEVAASRIRADEPIQLVVGEAVDPASLHADDFELSAFVVSQTEGRSLERLRVEVALVQNSAGEARIEIWPARIAGRRPEFAPATYHLWIDPERSVLADMSGQRLPAAWVWTTGRPAEIGVRPAPRDAPVGRVAEEFIDSRHQSAEPPPGADGTLGFGGGIASLRWPAVAGDGRDGPVVLAGTEHRSHITATGLVLPAGESAVLAASGMVVLAAQGAIEIDGRLVRRVEADGRTFDDREPPLEWLSRLRAEGTLEPTPALEAQPGEDLSALIARAQAEGLPWTVLVAGGDLHVRGELRVDGALILVAGGWIRASGPVTARQIWRSERGGGVELRPEPTTLPVPIDEPVFHPFAADFRFGALSGPIRPAGGVARWRGANVLASGDGIRVRYLGERDLPGGAVATVGPFDDPAQLGDAAAVRIWIEFDVGPRAPLVRWVSPRVDRVELSYDPAEPVDRAGTSR